MSDWLFVAATLTVGAISNTLFARARSHRLRERVRLPTEPRREADAPGSGPAAVVSGGTTPRSRARVSPRR
ncbi:hypothetical protein [Streptomyces lincolnensis]|uniref:hypothetical protein n=1 Tax=Streptomyces lincolnensis TaxID=1915 RepID=UPI000830113B|nr:hypothetical protein [Streptomyces lincolnensis]QMV06600.1 hypothetical protein GJU35_13545 [Streptomyces lincolnensis]